MPDDPSLPVNPAGDRSPEPVDPAPEAASGSRRTAMLTGLVGAVIAALAIFYVARRLINDWAAAKDAIGDASIAWLVAGAIGAGAGMTAMAAAWGPVLRLLGVRVRQHRVIAWYYVGELGKYLPGGVWTVVGRGELARRGGVPRSRAYASVGLSLALLYLAAMFVAAAFLPFAVAGSGLSPWMLVLLVLPVGLAALHHTVLEWALGWATKLTGRTIDLEIPRWGETVRLIVRYVPAWLFVGGGTWAVARALDPTASFSRVMFAAVLSWVAGFIAIPVPAGAGVREAVLAATSGLSGGVAAATAIIARLLFAAVDVIGAAVAAPAVRERRGGVTVGPIPDHERVVEADATDR